MCLKGQLTRRVTVIMNPQVIVATNMGLAESVKVDEACRQQGTAFIRAELHGVFGSVFCDFGSTFTVLDVDGACLPGEP